MKSLYALLLFVICTMPYSLFAQDWANLTRFKKANEKLSAPAEGENRVVFMGNSITEGWIQDSLTLFKNPHNINRGIGGQTTPQMKIRFWQDVIKLQPKAVVILAGINDIAQNTGYISIDETAQHIEDMALLAKAYDIKVVICSTLPANYFPWRPHILPADKVIALNTLLKSIAAKHEVAYLDYYTPMVDDKKGMKTEYTTDGVHCTLAGYRKMEELIKPVLERL
ncbi:MAG: GDSL-type esterase/lipase family protein [Flavobacteriaceae bacterium]|nr:acylhydrolase [Flavobacteriaceae bacterium]